MKVPFRYAAGPRWLVVRSGFMTDDTGSQEPQDEDQPAQPWLGSAEHREWQARNREQIAEEVERIGEETRILAERSRYDRWVWATRDLVESYGPLSQAILLKTMHVQAQAALLRRIGDLAPAASVEDLRQLADAYITLPEPPSLRSLDDLLDDGGDSEPGP